MDATLVCSPEREEMPAPKGMNFLQFYRYTHTLRHGHSHITHVVMQCKKGYPIISYTVQDMSEW